MTKTAAPLGSRTVRIICQRLLQPTGRFRRRSMSLIVKPLRTYHMKSSTQTSSRLRRHPVTGGLLAALAICMFYVLSVGPAFRLFIRGKEPPAILYFVYYPLSHLPDPISKQLEKYTWWWMRIGRAEHGGAEKGNQ